MAKECEPSLFCSRALVSDFILREVFAEFHYVLK
jgi:hypothetical protein